MSSEKNLQSDNSDLLELPPAYDEVGTSSQVPVNEKNKDELNSENSRNNNGGDSERNMNDSGSSSTDRGYHPASFLFGIPIIGMLARKAMQFEHRMSEHHHHHHGRHGYHGHHGNHWSHGWGHGWGHHHHHHGHHHGFDMNPFDNHHHHGRHKSHWGHSWSQHERQSNRHQRRMERRERRCNRKMERDLARGHKHCC